MLDKDGGGFSMTVRHMGLRPAPGRPPRPWRGPRGRRIGTNANRELPLSGLTKLFVGLLAVLSIVLSAATVASVATLDNYVEQADTQAAQIATLEAEAQRKDDEYAARLASATNSQTQLRGQLTKLRSDLEGLENDLSARRAELTTARQTVSEVNAVNAAATSALNNAQQAQQVQQEQLAQLRTRIDEVTTQNVELNTELGNVAASRQVLDRERRNLAERLRELQQQQTRTSRALEDAGLDPRAIAEGRTRVQGNPPPINGVVVDLRTVGGNTVVTVSVGSNDDVREGTEFKVVDQTTGNFLGNVTIQYVDADESVGFLTGPGVANVDAGDEVLTQFRS